jgi:hypothetical protein
MLISKPYYEMTLEQVYHSGGKSYRRDALCLEAPAALPARKRLNGLFVDKINIIAHNERESEVIS